MSRILIVDDEASICYALRECLSDEGHQVEVAASAEAGLKCVEDGPAPDALVVDVRLPGLDGLSALSEFRAKLGPVPIVVITAFGSLETAVQAMERGAFDYLVKPFDLDQASTVLKRALEEAEPPNEPGASSPNAVEEPLVGRSPAMQALFKSIAIVAPTEAPVLITGESGTGKEQVARAIHAHSPRRSGPFLPICLAAISPGLVERELFGHLKGSFTGAERDRPGLLELASGGTVLLDEIGDVPLELQVKLLRAIERLEVTPVGDARPRPIDLRVIAATNRPLEERIAAGQFREDLYFRLSVFPIRIPPLRERLEDLPALAEHFLRRSRISDTGAGRLSEEVLEALHSRAWPGNVRELRNAVEHAAIVARGQPIRPEHLPPPPKTSTSGPGGASESPEAALASRLDAWARRAATQPAERKSSSEAWESEPALYDRFLELTEPPVLRAVLHACGGNRAEAARRLGIHRATLRQKLNKYGIS